jgi:vacuolar-type H+-ATPase subunit H
MAERNRG